MNNSLIPWIATAAAILLMPILTYLVLRSRRASTGPLPNKWAITARPVFSAEERRIYRVLREALPHHIILSKLPLVRFCQPTRAEKRRYWFELLGNHHVTFAVCSANGRVLAAIDLDTERGQTARVLKIKQAVLEACRVRHATYTAGYLPSLNELQLLVPQVSPPPRPAAPSSPLNEARESLATTVANRRAQRSASADSAFQDSFFAPNSRLEPFANSDFITLSDRPENTASIKDRPSRGSGRDSAGVGLDHEATASGGGGR